MKKLFLSMVLVLVGFSGFPQSVLDMLRGTWITTNETGYIGLDFTMDDRGLILFMDDSFHITQSFSFTYFVSRGYLQIDTVAEFRLIDGDMQFYRTYTESFGDNFSIGKEGEDYYLELGETVYLKSDILGNRSGER